ncbi:MAG: substrate-binding domain-containing protein [Candidatus Dormibacteria bacterium]
MRHVRRHRLVMIAAMVSVALLSVPLNASADQRGVFCDPTTRSSSAYVNVGTHQATDVMNLFISSYLSKCPDHSVGFAPGNDDAAINGLLFRTTIASIMDRPMTDQEQSEVQSDTARGNLAQGQLFTLPMLVDPLAVIYNVSCAGSEPLQLSSSTLGLIFSGAITNWGDTTIQADNPNNSNLKSCLVPIRVAHDVGTTSLVFKDYLGKRNPHWRTFAEPQFLSTWPGVAHVACSASGGANMVACVGAQPGTIGYAEYRYVQGSGVAVVQVDNPAHQFSAPSLSGCTSAADNNPTVPKTDLGSWSQASLTDSASGYPLCFFLYDLTWQAPFTTAPDRYSTPVWRNNWDFTHCWLGVPSTQNPSVTCTPNPQTLLPGIGYASLPASVVTEEQTSLDNLGGYSAAGP